jgi:hypothetical protein
MKYLLFIVLLVGIIITAGCIGGNQNSAVTPTPQIVYVTVLVTPTPTIAQAQDPIIGVWRNSDSSGYDDRIRFNADGTFVGSFYSTIMKETYVYSGTWSAQGGNSYLVNGVAGTRETSNYIYDPARNAIYDTEYPPILLTPYLGNIAAASVSASIPASSSQSSSSSPIHFSGNGDDVRTFTATGTGLRVFSMSYSGQHNFAIKLLDSDGEWIELLVNTIGTYSGKKTARLSTGKYILDIIASGPWTIDISSI